MRTPAQIAADLERCYERVEMPKPRYDDDCDIYDTAESGQRAGIPWTLAWTMGSLNDEEWGKLSPEERWLAARRWINEQLAKGIA
jgi:hypothetical protein